MKKVFNKILTFIKTNITTVIIIFLFVFLIVVDNLKTPLTNDIINNFRVVASSFSPKTGIFSDDSEISYVSYVFNFLNPGKEISFNKPTTISAKRETEYELSYDYSGIVFAASSGVVKSVGYVGEDKYIEISHSEGYVTKYVGIETFGVCANEVVNSKQAIGVVKKGNEWTFSIFKENTKFKISEVKWEK